MNLPICRFTRSCLCRLAFAVAIVAVSLSGAQAQQVITTARTGPVYGNNNSITVTTAGSVTALGVTNPLWTAFETTAGNTITVLQNAGMVTARATAVYGNQAISQITNSGTFRGNSGIEIYGGGSIATLQNNATGLISGSSFWGIRNTGTGSVITSATNAGTITAAYVGVRNEYGGTMGGLTNSSLIRGVSFDAIQNVNATITQITNSGTLNGQGRSGIQNEEQSGGTALIRSITNSGMITGTYGIQNWRDVGTATTGTISNSGSISGTAVGVFNNKAAITVIENNAGGTISGVKTTGTIGTLANNGSINDTAASPIGVHVAVDGTASGRINAMSGGGSILGRNFGVKIEDEGQIDAFQNAGTVSNSRTDDLQYGGLFSEGIVGTLTNSGTFSGWGFGIRSSFVTGTISNLSGGVIGTDPASTSESAAALLIEGDINAIANAGLITSSGGVGLVFQAPELLAGSVTNSGTISGAAIGIGLTAGVQITRVENMATGVIRGGVYGVGNAGGGIQAIVNAGTITSTSDDEGAAIATAGSVESLDNSGTISGAVGFYRGGGGTGTLVNSGLIQGRVGDGILLESSTLAQLTNSGRVTGSGNGIVLTTDASLATLVNTGTLTADSSAIWVQDPSSVIAHITNSGLAESTGSSGMELLSTGTVINTAAGEIISGNDSGLVLGGTTALVTNAGRIGVTGNIYGAGVEVDFESVVKKLTNTGRIFSPFGAGTAVRVGFLGALGDSTGAGGPALTSTGSGALIEGKIVNAGTIFQGFTIENQDVVVSANGGRSTFSDGVLNVVDGNLSFVPDIPDDTFLLQADVSVNGGAGTFDNQGILALITSQDVTGNFATGSSATVQPLVFSTASFGSLAITGTASFNGGLDLIRGPGFSLADGQSFSLFSYQSATGGFSSLSVDGVALVPEGASTWKYGSLWVFETVGPNELSITVSAVPEPTTLASVVAGAACGGFITWRRRKRS